jgi:hypothetical protein
VSYLNVETINFLADCDELDMLDRHADAIAVSPTVAAALTGRSREAIRAAADSGTLPASGSVHRRIRHADLAAWHGRQLVSWRRVADVLNRRAAPRTAS